MFLVFLSTFLCGLVSAQSPIKRVVVLMMENRAFDHLLGWQTSYRPDIDGLTGNECNHYNTTDPNSPFVCVNKNGPDKCPDDPGHGYDDVLDQVFGSYNEDESGEAPLMDGFVANAVDKGHDPSNPMSMFTKAEDSAPVINTLSEQYVTFDKWFVSVPSSTDPNRAFAMSGTSNGMTTNFNGTLWNQQSYFDFLTQHKVTWRGYYQDDPWALFYFNDTVNKPENAQNMFEFDQFYTDVQRNALPQFSFLQPRMNPHKDELPTWQHPTALLSEGERLIKDVYEAIVGSPEVWADTALIITYDEHGGFYDHVPPPMEGIPSPDGVVAPNGFEFDRLGIRVPAVLVSAWVEQGFVEHYPTAGPSSTSQYEHTSLLATCNEIFGITDKINDRVSWAGTFSHLFKSEQQPRMNPGFQLGPVVEPPPGALEWIRKKPLNDHTEAQIKFYCAQNKRDQQQEGEGRKVACGEGIHNIGDATDFLDGEIAYFLNNLRKRHQFVQQFSPEALA